MLKGIRIRAFNRYARGRGKEALLARLEENAAAGIVYHRPGGLAGDYDALPTEREIVRLIQFGMGPNPYILCPEYETRHFTLRLVCPQDARDLLDCYADPAARACFNADGCHSDFAFDTEQEVAQCIAFWQQDYEVDAYIRFAIVERESGRAVGTVEAHERPSDDGGEALGIMRLDIASRFEYAEYLRELIEVSLRHYRLLHTPSVVVKAPPAAKERAAALASLGFAPVDFSDGDGYYRITL